MDHDVIPMAIIQIKMNLPLRINLAYLHLGTHKKLMDKYKKKKIILINDFFYMDL